MRIFGEEKQLVITLEGAERFWAVKNKVVIPKNVIASIKYFPDKPKRRLGLPFFKLPGTVLPGILLAGNFVKPGEREFWYIRPQHAGVLSIETEPGSFTYHKIVLSCNAPIAQDVVDWWQSK